MNEGNAEQHTSKILLALSIVGSVASIIALLIVLLQIAAARSDVSEQFMVWRSFLALAALVGCGGIATLAFAHVRETLAGTDQDKSKIIRISLVIAGALVLEAVFLDGFFAALYWSKWLYIIWWPLWQTLIGA